MAIKKKVAAPKKKIARGTIPRFKKEVKVEPIIELETTPRPVEVPMIGPLKIIETLKETDTEVHYVLEDGSTTCVAK